MIKGKINLAAFSHAIMDAKRKDGTSVKGIFIPIEANGLFHSDKGNVYVDFVAREIPAEKRKGKDTHMVSQSVDKEVYDALRAQQKYPPTIGNMTIGSFEPAPAAAAEEMTPEPGMDLPF
jgi:hypothetical protein